MIGKSEVQAWIGSFMGSRNLHRPTGAPLYRYNVTEAEFGSLAPALIKSRSAIHSPTYGLYWAAAFCLFVAEQYRRDYQKKWSWQSFESSLNLELTANDHAEIVKKGLKYWDRDVQRRSKGADYLGSLFSEGGLPWALIQSEQHGFARAVSGGLKRYFTTLNSSTSLTDVIRDYELYFPLTFRTEEKYQLLASIVEALMYLAEEYELSGAANPSERLNSLCPGWQSQFPLPITESSGAALVDKWLGDAAHQRHERKQQLSQAMHFTCKHTLLRLNPTELYSSQVTLAPNYKINLDQAITTVRIELVLIEGEHEIIKLGSTYGKLSDDRNTLEIQLPKDPIQVHRQDVSLPLELALVASGQHLERIPIRDSDVPLNSAPVAFEIYDTNRLDNLDVIGWMSVNTSKDTLLLRLPVCTPFSGCQHLELLQTSPNAEFYLVSTDTAIASGDIQYLLSLNQPAGRLSFSIHGQLCRGKTYPNATYLGWPTIRVVDAKDDAFECNLHLNGSPINSHSAYSMTGRYELTATGPSGELIAKKLIGILPRDFDYHAFAESQNYPAKIILRTQQPINVQLENQNYVGEINSCSGSIELSLTSTISGDSRPPVDISVAPSLPSGEALSLRLPFPKEGAKITDENGNIIKDRTITLEQLIGKRLELTSSGHNNQNFTVSVELVNAKHRQTRSYQYSVSLRPTIISLGALTDDFIALLSSEPRQDLTARLSVESSSIVRQVDVKRYNGQIVFGRKDPCYFNIIPEHNTAFTESPSVCVISLYDPASSPLFLEPTAYDEQAGWGFQIAAEMMNGDPWLIYPTSESMFKFRPSFFARDMFDGIENASVDVASTMGDASRAFHPRFHPNAFDNAISLMANDPMDVGWDYMKATKKTLSHLPLASLEAWRGLVSNTEALALSVLRLDIDHLFAERLSNELSVLWESVRNTDWLKAIESYRHWIRSLTGLPTAQVDSMLVDRLRRLGSVIPIFEDFTEELVLGKSGPPKNPLPASYMILHMNLRRHRGDAQWPEMLSASLSSWVNKHSKHFNWLVLSNAPPFTHAVSLAPLFLAALTLGQANVNELGEDVDYIRYALRSLKEFDRDDWYAPIYKTVLVQYALRGNHQNDWYDN